jgi:histidine triad (HIT) family protein
MGYCSRLVFQSLRLVSRVARPISQRLLPWFLTSMSFLIPEKRLFETETLVAFHHPRPSYRVHILLLPKGAIASPHELDPNKHGQFLADLFRAVRALVDEFHLQDAGYRLITNGGKHQDIPLLHFHLVSAADPDP